MYCKMWRRSILLEQNSVVNTTFGTSLKLSISGKGFIKMIPWYASCPYIYLLRIFCVLFLHPVGSRPIPTILSIIVPFNINVASLENAIFEAKFSFTLHYLSTEFYPSIKIIFIQCINCSLQGRIFFFNSKY